MSEFFFEFFKNILKIKKWKLSCWNILNIYNVERYIFTCDDIIRWTVLILLRQIERFCSKQENETARSRFWWLDENQHWFCFVCLIFSLFRQVNFIYSSWLIRIKMALFQLGLMTKSILDHNNYWKRQERKGQSVSEH